MFALGGLLLTLWFISAWWCATHLAQRVENGPLAAGVIVLFCATIVFGVLKEIEQRQMRAALQKTLSISQLKTTELQAIA